MHGPDKIHIEMWNTFHQKDYTLSLLYVTKYGSKDTSLKNSKSPQ